MMHQPESALHPEDERDSQRAPAEPKPRAGAKTKAKTTTGRDGKAYSRKRPTPDVPQPSRRHEPSPRTIAMRKANSNPGAIEGALGCLDEAVTVLADAGIIGEQNLSDRLSVVITRLLVIASRITLAVKAGERITDTIRSGEDGDDDA